MQGSTRGAPPGSQQVQFASVGGQELLATAVELRDDTGAALSTDALPVSLSTMPNGTFFMDWSPSDGTYFYRVYGAIGSQSVVPEPSVSVIFLLGGCAASLRWGHLVRKTPADQRG